MGWEHTLRELAEVVCAGEDQNDGTFSAVSTDTRTLEDGDVFFALSGEHFNGNAFVAEAFRRGAVSAVTTQAFNDGPCLVVENPLTALQDFAAYHRSRFDVPIFAITGSCGKTSTKDLTAALLATKFNVVKTAGNFNNEIGCPLSLLNFDPSTEIGVIEMGANHRGEIARLCALAKPTESAITMVGPAHLEGFGSVDNVAKAKGEIIACLSDDGVFYVNNDDEWCRELARQFAGPKVTFGEGGDVTLEGVERTASGELRLTVSPVGEMTLPLYSRSHVSNVLLAIAVALHHGVEEFEGPLRDACGNASRFKVFKVGPLEVIDDTYNANPSSMAAALDTLAERGQGASRIAALGDMLELGEAARDLHEAVGRRAGDGGVTHLFARGDFAGDVVRSAKNASVPHAEAIEDHDDMAAAIHEVAAPGDILLVKGSRGMTMEKVIDALRSMYENN